jgi:hypothetical protein
MVAREECEAAEAAEGDRRWRFDDEAAAGEAGLLFMVDGVVLICELKAVVEAK